MKRLERFSRSILMTSTHLRASASVGAKREYTYSCPTPAAATVAVVAPSARAGSNARGYGWLWNLMVVRLKRRFLWRGADGMSMRVMYSSGMLAFSWKDRFPKFDVLY